MKYHNITHDDMLNGDGLRVVLWVSGCKWNCPNCHNPITHDINNGIEFDEKAKQEIFDELSKDYIEGITFSGGDPLHNNNVSEISELVYEIKQNFPTKTIWVYSGYLFEDVISPKHEHEDYDAFRLAIVINSDVFVDGTFKQELANKNYHWAGSTNQRVIDVKESLRQNKGVLY